MHLFTSALLALASSLAFAAPAEDITKRQQSTTWKYTCSGSSRAPDNFKAFDLGSCTAQLSFNKDSYIGIQWTFDAIYADGSRATYKPFRDFNNFGVSDTFYPYLGNNFLTRLPGSSAFTAVHEFTNVCKDNRVPVAWVFNAKPSDNFCTPRGYSYTSGQIRTVGGVSRPAKVSGVAIGKINTAGDYAVTWNEVAQASAYSVIVEYPTGTDDVGNAYKDVRGERIRGGTTRAVVPTGTRRIGDSRRAIVHCVNAQGVWSFTNDVQSTASSE